MVGQYLPKKAEIYILLQCVKKTNFSDVKTRPDVYEIFPFPSLFSYHVAVRRGQHHLSQFSMPGTSMCVEN
jgi:hypothetical protein